MSFFEKVGEFFGLKPHDDSLKLPAQQISEKDVPINASAAKIADWISCWDEYRLRDLAFNCCVNLIAKAIANCEFRTLERGQPVKKDYYYMLNVEPNVNENSTAFWQKVIYKLYRNNEALIIALPGKGSVNLAVADSWTRPECIPSKENVYRQIQIGDESYTRTLQESEVIHLVLNSADAKAVVDALYSSYNKLLQAGMKNYNWNAGQHVKVHIDQVSSGQDDFEKRFAEMANEQYKPFLQNDFGILPEFDGYNFSRFEGGGGQSNTRDIRALIDDIFVFTARGFGIPPVLVQGEVAGISDIVTNWLTTCIDPLAAQIGEELNRKLYGRAAWRKGDRIIVDTSTIQHFDMLANANNIEKIIESAYCSINETREITGLAPLPDEWANIHWMTKNIATVEAVARSAAAASTEERGKKNA